MIGVGGTEFTGQRWVESSSSGSNFGPQPGVVAPAREVVSSFVPGYSWIPGSCEDNGFIGPGYGLCTGTSMAAPLVTSIVALMRSANPLQGFDDSKVIVRETASPASPVVEYGSGIPNALEAVRTTLGILRGPASLCNSPLPGICRYMPNRLTPMFHSENTNPTGQSGAVNCTPLQLKPLPGTPRPRDASPATGAQLFTSRPQVATAAITNELYVSAYEIYPQKPCLPPLSWAFTSPQDPAIPNAQDYLIHTAEFYASSAPEANLIRGKSSFFVLATEARVPQFGNVATIPLYRLSFDSPWPAEVAPTQQTDICPSLGRDFAYVTNASQANWFLTSHFCYANSDLHYRNDAIEGYLLASCPSGFICDGEHGEFGAIERVYLRGKSGANADWALLLASQLPGVSGAPAMFAGYTETAPGVSQVCPDAPSVPGCLGYAFRNVSADADRLIDGVELMLGTLYNHVDTDGDGLHDDFEYRPYSLVVSNPLIADPDLLFIHGFERP